MTACTARGPIVTGGNLPCLAGDHSDNPGGHRYDAVGGGIDAEGGGDSDD